MEPETLGALGAWLGGGIGVLGGLFGTYVAVKNTRSARERAYVIKAAILCLVLVSAFLAGVLLIPTWHRHLLWIPYVILLTTGIRSWNRTQIRIRNEETGESA